jgi:CHAD domain-containing protein
LKKNLPDILQTGFDYVVREINKLRANEYLNIKEFLLSEDFNNILKNWNIFLLNLNHGVSEKKIIDFALNSIFLRYQSIVKKGKKINPETPDEELHQLRIECKKLRYLLEFFISILPENETKKLIEQIRNFQLFLGKFNDFSVQQNFVYRILNEVELAENEKIKFMTAVGGLINYLHIQKIEIRKYFDIEFTKFISHTPQFIIPKK